MGKITGSGFLEQMAGLIADLNDLFGGFKERATRVSKAFRGSEFGYVMVTSPAPLAVDEVLYFAERLRAQGLRSDAFVVNRLHRRPPAVPTEEQIRSAMDDHRLTLGADATGRVRRAVDDEVALADLDRGHVERLTQATAPPGAPSPTVIRIPALPSDVHDISTLAGIATVLCPETA
jgi:hypothetical protein